MQRMWDLADIVAAEKKPNFESFCHSQPDEHSSYGHAWFCLQVKMYTVCIFIPCMGVEAIQHYIHTTDTSFSLLFRKKTHLLSLSFLNSSLSQHSFTSILKEVAIMIVTYCAPDTTARFPEHIWPQPMVPPCVISPPPLQVLSQTRHLQTGQSPYILLLSSEFNL